VRGARAVSERKLSPGELSLEPPLPELGCAEGTLELTVVQPPGRRAMTGEEFLRGRRS
jgi:methionyl-tRNA formyltransferase